jgi:hypothetical protein
MPSYEDIEGWPVKSLTRLIFIDFSVCSVVNVLTLLNQVQGGGYDIEQFAEKVSFGEILNHPLCHSEGAKRLKNL